MVPDRTSVLTVCLAAALLVSGCAGQDLTEQQEKQVVERFEQRLAELDGYHATVTTTVEVGNHSSTSTAEVWARPGTGKMRWEVLEPDDRAGRVTVSNGSVMWSYSPDEQRATRIDLPNATGTGLAARVGELVERNDLVFNGTATLDGTETYKVTLVPNESADRMVESTTTLWLSKDSLFPMKMHTEVGNDTETTVRFRNVELDPGIPDERFRFDPPENVTVEEPTVPDVESFEERDALADAADRTLPDPTLPGDFAFERGTLVGGDERQMVSLTYTNGTADVSVSAMTAPDRPATDGTTVDIGGQTGTYDSIGDVGMVAWTCGDTRYSVTGSLPKATLVDVAASIEC